MLLFVILAYKYRITTSLNFLSIDNFCSIKEVTLTIWITVNSWQQALTYKDKRPSILDYLNLTVTVDKLLATKKKGQS